MPAYRDGYMRIIGFTQLLIDLGNTIFAIEMAFINSCDWDYKKDEYMNDFKPYRMQIVNNTNEAYNNGFDNI